MTCAFEQTHNQMVACGGLDNLCSIYMLNAPQARVRRKRNHAPERERRARERSLALTPARARSAARARRAAAAGNARDAGARGARRLPLVLPLRRREQDRHGERRLDVHPVGRRARREPGELLGPRRRRHVRLAQPERPVLVRDGQVRERENVPSPPRTFPLRPVLVRDGQLRRDRQDVGHAHGQGDAHVRRPRERHQLGARSLRPARGRAPRVGDDAQPPRAFALSLALARALRSRSSPTGSRSRPARTTRRAASSTCAATRTSASS